MSEVIRAYWDAVAKLSTIDNKLDVYAEELEAIAKELREKRDTLQFYNLPGGHGPLVGHYSKHGRDADKFPPVMLQATLNERLIIKDELRDAWKAIPEAQRASLPVQPD